jgi:hypothetical protein
MHGSACSGRLHAPRQQPRETLMFTNTPRLDEVPTPIWIALGLLGFLVWWPLGLLVLALAIWRGSMLCCGFGFGHGNDRVDRSPAAREGAAPPRTSGNRAFDAYREDTLKRLEEEQRSFREYLERLRNAKDRAEFEQFMEERRARQPQA